MSIPAILLAILAIALVAFLVLRGRAAPADQPDEDRGPDTVVGAGVPISQPGSRQRQEEFDPTATQVYMRPSAEEAPAAPQRREGAAASRVQRARLIGLSGSLKGRTFEVAAAGITVGRAPSCELRINDPRISNRHAWIGLVDGKAVLKDLGSTNGTFLNAHTRSTISETELCSGDTISFGGHQGDQFRIVLG